MRNTILLCTALCLSSSTYAQQQLDSLSQAPDTKPSPTMPVEVLVGKNGLGFQMIVSKHFSPESRFGFFNVTHFVGDYKVVPVDIPDHKP